MPPKSWLLQTFAKDNTPIGVWVLQPTPFPMAPKMTQPPHLQTLHALQDTSKPNILYHDGTGSYAVRRLFSADLMRRVWQILNQVGGPCVVTCLILYIVAVLGFIVYPSIPDGTIALQVLNYVAAAGAVACCWLCNLSDPGTVIPSAHDPAPPDDPSDATQVLQTVPGPDGKDVVLKWCRTCRLWRPPRASHCHECGRCFHRFDHHCVVVANCVALSTMRWFLLFLFFGVLGCMLGAAATIWALLGLHPFDAAAWTGGWKVYVLMVFLCCPCPPLIGLIPLCFLIIPFLWSVLMLAGGVTYKERLRKSRGWCEEGACEDLHAVCCTPVEWRWDYGAKAKPSPAADPDPEPALSELQELP